MVQKKKSPIPLIGTKQPPTDISNATTISNEQIWLEYVELNELYFNWHLNLMEMYIWRQKRAEVDQLKLLLGMGFSAMMSYDLIPLDYVRYSWD